MPVRRKHGDVVCRHSRCAPVNCRYLLSSVHLLGWIASGLRVSANLQITPCLIDRLGSEVLVIVSFQNFPLRIFVCHGRHVFCHPVCFSLCQQGHFSVPPVLLCFRVTTMEHLWTPNMLVITEAQMEWLCLR